MPDNKDLKIAIQSAIAAFEKKPLAEASLDLLGTLGYRSDRRQISKLNNAKQFRAEFDASGKMNSEAALFSDWQTVDFLFQLTDAEINSAASGMANMFASKKVDDKDIRSYLFFAVELKGRQYTRTQLAGITREINKLFPMPVMVIFRYDEVVSLAIIARRINKRDGSKDVLEKVTLIKDIRFTGNRAQIEILHDLAITQLMQDYAISNFVDLQHAWEKTLDLNELNKKFYKEIANWYFWAVKTVKFPKDAEKDEATRNATGVIRLITRLIFVWFIKEKGLVPEELFDERWLKDTLKFEDPKKSTYYKAILQNLFFATLNTEMGEGRMFRRKNTGGLDPDYLMSNYYRYKHYFRNPEQGFKIFAGIPFLNGGLFECLDKEIEKGNVIRVDGFSDRDDNPLTVPDDLFLMEKEKEIDLNEIYDTKNKKYKVRGLIHIFNSYKFTIEENTPIEEEIALDPELLGKVFENLLAAYNPETGTTARKQTGSFYTPREIVNYMVDEALLAYLNAEGGVQNAEFEERLRDLLSYNPNPPAFSDAEKFRLIAAIDNVKVLDPAAGSGAFPMGVLHKLVFLLAKLDPKNEGWQRKQISKANEIQDSVAREAAVRSIEEVFAENHDDYGRKLYLIENCIYGVDIQPIAVQIAKLRFFISLVVDQKTNAKKPNLGIRPLPNLETKFVAANTLIGIQRPNSKSENEARASASIPPEVEEACELLIRKLEQFLKSRNPDLRARYVQEAQEFADVINAGMGADFQPLAVDWVFSTAKDTAALKTLLPVKREAKASPMVLRNQQIEEKEKELERVRRDHFSARTPATKRKCRDLDKKLRLEIADLLSKNHALEDEAAQQLAGWDPYNQNAHADFFDPEWMFGVEGGFDVVIGNPPYGLINKRQNKAEAIVVSDDVFAYYKNSTEYAHASSGMINIFRLFIVKSVNLLKGGGALSEIFPLSFVADVSAAGLRKNILENCSIDFIEAFPERDDESKRVFEAAKMSVCIMNLRKVKNVGKKFFVRIHGDRFVDMNNSKAYFDLDTLLLLDRNNATIPLMTQRDAEVITKIYKKSKTFSEIGHCYTGEIDLTLGKKYLTDNTNHAVLIKGAILDRYLVRKEMSQGEIKFLDSKKYLSENTGGKAQHHKKTRIVMQGITGVNEKVRLKMTIASPNTYCGNSANYMIFNEDDEEINFFLGVLNSKISNYIFSKFSTNSNVNGYEVDNLPYPVVKDEKVKQKITSLVIKILVAKRADPQADMSALEGEIDQLIYQLYGLTKDEIDIVEVGI